MFEDENPNWEAELQQRVGAILTSRLDPLKAELERLQAALAATSVTASAEEVAAFNAQVKTLVAAAASQAEQQFQQRLETAVAQGRAELRQQLETEFQTQLEQSRAEAEQQRSQLAALTASQALNVEATAVAPTPPNYSLLKTAIEEIDAQRTQSETLTTLINRAAHFSPRIAFYVVKSGEAVGWKAHGFENGLSDETVRSLAVSIQGNSLLSQALNEQHTTIALSPTQAEIAVMLGRFSHPVPAGAAAVPLVVRGKAAAVLYADSGTQAEDAVQLEALETLVHVASMAIELLPARRNAGEVARSQPTVQPSAQPAPAPATPTVETPASAEATPPAIVATPVVESAPQPVTQPVAPESAAPVQAQEPEAPAPAVAEPVAGYVGDPTTNKPAEWQPAASTPEPEPVPAAPPVAATPAKAPAEADEVPSIFDLLRGAPSAPGGGPSMSLPGYPAPPESPSLEYAGGVPQPSGASGAALPDWMQRLQDEQPTSEAPAPLAPNPAWGAPEAAPVKPPAPPTPPPVRVPSLSDFANRLEQADTDRLSTPAAPPIPLPTPAAPFQADAPSVRFSFNQPSEPPRYAAPSLSVTNAATETEVRAHNDARRFARLLVSEIKLYNAAKVNEGRRQADLYDRLHDEIDRSRKVYDKRVSPAVAQKFDYFYDELVQTLAEGDPSKLGENCPGPVMIAQ